MEENIIIDDRLLMAISLYFNVTMAYSRYISLRRKIKMRQMKQRLNYLEKRPNLYCQLGYDSTIYRAVILRDESVIRKHLRVSPSALDRLVTLMPKKTHGWTARFELVVFLYWLACGASYRVTAASFDISRYTVSTIVHRNLDFFVKIVPTVIKYPSRTEFARIGEGFNQRSRTTIFSNAVGAIDGTHVKISVPVRLRDQYINRKLDYTIQLQAVCDSTGKFISICVGYPGSVHDQRVLRNSELYKRPIFPDAGYFLLGDSGYKCSLQPIRIITPYKRGRQNISCHQQHFNLVHSKARSIIEAAFGLMKGRWRAIFKKTLELKIENSIKTIAACCVMHNICLGDSFDEEENLEEISEIENHETDDVDDDDNDALVFRESLVQQLTNRRPA